MYITFKHTYMCSNSISYNNHTQITCMGKYNQDMAGIATFLSSTINPRMHYVLWIHHGVYKTVRQLQPVTYPYATDHKLLKINDITYQNCASSAFSRSTNFV